MFCIAIDSFVSSTIFLNPFIFISLDKLIFYLTSWFVLWILANKKKSLFSGNFNAL